MENNTIDILGLKLTITGPVWFQSACSVLLLSLVIGSLFWIAKDADRRGKNPFGAIIFAMFALYPVSLVWWVWLRPPLRESIGKARPFRLGPLTEEWTEPTNNR
jgi:hypothetical protein